MPSATLRFYEELNDFLPPSQRKVAVTHTWRGTESVKHLVESSGVPHTEVDLILVNGASVDFSYHPRDGDQISVYPVFEAFDISTVSHLRPRPLRETQFVVDGHLGRLAAYLRLAGFDTWWQKNADDAALARISHDEHRILLTRDRGLLKRRLVTHGYYVRSNLPREQLREVIKRLDLGQGIQPFTRCLVCNGQLQPVAGEALTGQVLPRTLEDYRAFWRCEHCGKVYWQGSHYQRLRTLLDDVLAPGQSDAGSVTTSK